MTAPNRRLPEAIAAMQQASRAVADTAAQLRADKQAELAKAAAHLEEVRRASDSAGEGSAA